MPQEGTEIKPEGEKPEGKKAPEGQKPEGEKKPEAKPEGEKKKTGFDELPPETQDEIKKLRAEAAENRKAAAERQAKLDEIEDANKTEKERAEAKADRAEARATKAEVSLLRYKIASEKEVPADAMNLLTADTEEGLTAQAEQILSIRGEGEKPDFGAGARKPADEAVAPEEAHQRGILGILGLEPAPKE